MELGLEDREFYATFGGVSIEEARRLFKDYFEREPKQVVGIADRVLAGPVTKEEIRLETGG